MEQPIVQISEGKLKGTVLENYDGDKIYAFLGVPYAKPPVKELRFKSPVPVQSWKGTLDATKVGDKCIQQDLFDDDVSGTEDCLNLNVYTKELSNGTNKPKPVMFWIHGGAFLYGSNDPKEYGPRYLLTRDVVLVAVNYRLGIFGFLNLEDPSLDVPGNFGLKDQQLALKWVRRNVGSFNGDPDNVTIFGESAGSASVHYQILSSGSKGLFHKAILQSGALLSNWASKEKFSLLEFVELLGREAKSEKEALGVLRDVSERDLYDAQEKYLLSHVSTSLTFYPNVEKPSVDAFITEECFPLILSGNFNKTPTLISFTNKEGLYFELERKIKALQGKPLPQPGKSIEGFLPKKLLEENPQEAKAVADKLKEFYFTGENAKDPLMLVSDAIFIAPAIMTAKVNVKVSNERTYLCEITVDDDLNLLKKLAQADDIPGASHGDDIGYLFSNDLLPAPRKGSSAERTMRRMVKFWTNFAKYGNPTPPDEKSEVIWTPVTKEKIHYLEIGNELELNSDPYPLSVKLWEKVYKLELE